MLTISEIVRSVYGVWRLARFDAIGMEWLDRTTEGFWRSFLVALLLLPLEIVMTVIIVSHIAHSEPVGYVAATAGIAYVISWTIYPVLSHPLIGLLGRAERYTAYITAINWSRIVLFAVAVPITLLLFAGPSAIVDILVLGYYIGWGAYHWFITRTALDLGVGSAVGLTLMEMVLIIITDHVALTMMTAAAPAAG